MTETSIHLNIPLSTSKALLYVIILLHTCKLVPSEPGAT